MKIIKEGDTAYTTGAHLVFRGGKWLITGFEDDTYADDGNLIEDIGGKPYTGKLDTLCPHCNDTGVIIGAEGGYSVECNCHTTPENETLEDAQKEWNKYIEKENYILKNGEGAWLELHPEGH